MIRIERRHIPEHVRDFCPLRKVVCEYCEREVKASEINPHLEECREFPLPCPKGCSRERDEAKREVKRKDILDNHFPLQKVVSLLGPWIIEKMERRHTDRQEREFLDIHLKLTMTEMTQRQNESAQRLQHNLDIAQKQISKLQEQVNDITAQIESLSQVLYS